MISQTDSVQNNLNIPISKHPIAIKIKTETFIELS